MTTIYRALVLLAFIFITYSPIVAQQDSSIFKPFREWIIGAGAAYIEDVDNNDETNLYQEWTVLGNISTELSKRIRMGIDYRAILTNDPVLGQNNYFLIGSFTQYNFIAQRRSRFFAEVAFRYGNYCTCGASDPYQFNSLSYASWGLGGSIFLFHHLYLNIAFSSNIIINQIKNKYSYNHYVLGVEYKFNLSKNRI